MRPVWFTAPMGDHRAAPFVPFRTERLTVRAFRPDDAEALAAYRDDPDVARYQDWDLPYTVGRAQAAIAVDQHIGERLAGGDQWQLAIDRDGALIGDLYLGIDSTGSVATIGYTLAAGHQGAGHGSEAVGALIDRVLDELPTVHRIRATLDPENVRSIRLLEGLGFRSEGVARAAVRIRGAWVDDALYGLLREDRVAWLARPAAPPTDVRLVEVTAANMDAVVALETFGWQRRLVAPNQRSLAQALLPGDDDTGHPIVPWCRAIEADGQLAGFVMVAAPTPSEPNPYLWRFMIDRRHQRRGIGRVALGLVVEQAVAWGADALLVSWVPGVGSPAPFYLAHGFEPTGEVDEDEVVARLALGLASRRDRRLEVPQGQGALSENGFSTRMPP
jgi:RimJ/RimL family protein N-acetyltransferase